MLDIVMHNVLIFVLVNPPLSACERRSCCSRLSDWLHTGSMQFDKSGRKRQWRRYANGKTLEQNASIDVSQRSVRIVVTRLCAVVVVIVLAVGGKSIGNEYFVVFLVSYDGTGHVNRRHLLSNISRRDYDSCTQDRCISSASCNRAFLLKVRLLGPAVATTNPGSLISRCLCTWFIPM